MTKKKPLIQYVGPTFGTGRKAEAKKSKKRRSTGAGRSSARHADDAARGGSGGSGEGGSGADRGRESRRATERATDRHTSARGTERGTERSRRSRASRASQVEESIASAFRESERMVRSDAGQDTPSETPDRDVDGLADGAECSVRGTADGSTQSRSASRAGTRAASRTGSRAASRAGSRAGSRAASRVESGAGSGEGRSAASGRHSRSHHSHRGGSGGGTRGISVGDATENRDAFSEARSAGRGAAVAVLDEDRDREREIQARERSIRRDLELEAHMDRGVVERERDDLARERYQVDMERAHLDAERRRSERSARRSRSHHRRHEGREHSVATTFLSGRSNRHHTRSRGTHGEHDRGLDDDDGSFDGDRFEEGAAEAIVDGLDKAKRKRAAKLGLGALGAGLVGGGILSRLLMGKKGHKSTAGSAREVGDLDGTRGALPYGAMMADQEGFFDGVSPEDLLEDDALQRPARPGGFFVEVPQNMAYIVERGSKYHRKLEAGWHFLIPLYDKVVYVHSLKEECMPIPYQQSYTRDNISVRTNGVLFIKVEDPVSASYGVENPYRSVMILAQSSMRTEIGRLTFDRAIEERSFLNDRIVKIINEAARSWGLRCTRFELQGIEPPDDIRAVMEMQVEADRQKRADIIASEAERQKIINVAEGERQRQMIMSQAAQMEIVNRAVGEAQAITEKGEAIARSMREIADVMELPGGESAMRMRIAEQYIQAYGNLARTTNTVLMPNDPSNVAGGMAQAMGIFNTLGNGNTAGTNPWAAPENSPYHAQQSSLNQAQTEYFNNAANAMPAPPMHLMHPGDQPQPHLAGAYPPGAPGMNGQPPQGNGQQHPQGFPQQQGPQGYPQPQPPQGYPQGQPPQGYPPQSEPLGYQQQPDYSYGQPPPFDGQLPPFYQGGPPPPPGPMQGPPPGLSPYSVPIS